MANVTAPSTYQIPAAVPTARASSSERTKAIATGPVLSGLMPSSVSEESVCPPREPVAVRLIQRAEAVRRWLEVASACECKTLDVCGLFDDRALGLRDHERWPVGRSALTVIHPA